jgi:hypothetical protein
MARFWDWQAQPAATSAAASAVAVEEAPLEPVELYTATAMVFALVAPEHRRLSDILNSNSRLALRDASSTSLIDGVEGSARQGWTSLSTDEILLVMPPEHVSPRQMKVHRRQHRVRIRTGPFQIVGNAHVLPGTKLDPYALQTRMRFLAVTNAEVYSSADPAWERRASVVLVNVGPVEDLSEVLTIS